MEIMEDVARNTPNEREVIHHEVGTLAIDGDEGCHQAKPGSDEINNEPDNTVNREQANDLLRVTMEADEAADVGENEKTYQPNLGEPERSEGSTTKSQAPHYASMGADLRHAPTSRESTNLQNIVFPTEQMGNSRQECGTDTGVWADNLFNERRSETYKGQIASPGINFHREFDASEHSGEIFDENDDNINQSQANNEATDPETNSDLYGMSQRTLDDHTASGEEVNSIKGGVGSSKFTPTGENQNTPTSPNDNPMHSTEKFGSPVSSLSSNTGDQMDHETQPPSRQCDPYDLTLLSQIGNEFHANQMEVTTTKQTEEGKERDEDNPTPVNTEITHLHMSSLHNQAIAENLPALEQPLVNNEESNQNFILFSMKDRNVDLLDDEAAIMLENLYFKKKDRSLTITDINEAIMRGKPVLPIFYEEAPANQARATELTNTQKDERGDLTRESSWLTGSRNLKTYFCWPCLLFGEIAWTTPTTELSKNIAYAVKTHQLTLPHVSTFMKFLVHEAKLKREHEAQKQRDLEHAKQNENLLRILIHVILSNVKASTEELAESLILICSYKDDLRKFVDGKPSDFFVRFIETNLSHISKAMEQFFLVNISEEIKSAPFVSIIFEDINDVVDKSLIAVILRYVMDSGVAEERFVKLMKMGMSRAVADLLKAFNSVVREFRLAEKLVGFTYSGTLISPKEVIIFNKTVNRIYPKAMFFPYQEHNFKKIILQSLSHFPACRQFFYTAKGLAEFFKHDPRAIKTLITLGKVDVTAYDKRWDFDNDFITTIKDHYASITYFLECFNEYGFDWDYENQTQVELFLCFLKSVDTRVMVLTLSVILSTIDELSTAMEGIVDTELWNRLLSEATNKLSTVKNEGLGALIQGSNLISASEYAAEKVNSSITQQLFNEIIISTLLATNHRCMDMDIALVGPQHLRETGNWGPDRLAVFLQRIDIEPANYPQLRNEVKSFYGNPSRVEMNLEQSIQHIWELNIVDSAGVCKFLQLCLTLPTKNVYSTDSSPAVHRLHSLIQNNEFPKFFDLLVTMEKDFFRSMQNNEKFHKQVMEYCAQHCK